MNYSNCSLSVKRRKNIVARWISRATILISFFPAMISFVSADVKDRYKETCTIISAKLNESNATNSFDDDFKSTQKVSSRVRQASQDPGLIKLWKDHCEAAYDDIEAAGKQETLVYVYGGVAVVCGAACAAGLASAGTAASYLGPACTGAAVLGGLTDAILTENYLGAVLGIAQAGIGYAASSGMLDSKPAVAPAAATEAKTTAGEGQSLGRSLATAGEPGSGAPGGINLNQAGGSAGGTSAAGATDLNGNQIPSIRNLNETPSGPGPSLLRNNEPVIVRFDGGPPISVSQSGQAADATGTRQWTEYYGGSSGFSAPPPAAARPTSSSKPVRSGPSVLTPSRPDIPPVSPNYAFQEGKLINGQTIAYPRLESASAKLEWLTQREAAITKYLDDGGSGSNAVDEVLRSERAGIVEIKSQIQGGQNRASGLDSDISQSSEVPSTVTKVSSDQSPAQTETTTEPPPPVPSEKQSAPASTTPQPSVAQKVQWCMSVLLAAGQAYGKSKAKSADEAAAERELDIIESLRDRARKDAEKLEMIDTLREDNFLLRKRLEN